MEFILEITAPNRFAASARASWIARLNHETFDHTMENVTVVVAIFAVHTKVLHRLWTFAAKQFEMYIATRCMYRTIAVQFLETYRIKISIQTLEYCI